MSEKTMTTDELLAVMDEWIQANNRNRPRNEPKVRMDRELEEARAALAALVAERDALRSALIGVVRVADRKTDEFDAARAALAGAGHE